MSSTALRAAATGQTGNVAAQRPKTILDFLGDKRVADGLAAVAGRFLQPERMLRLCVNAVKKTPKLLECDPQTVLGAFMTSAALGLEPNTVQQQAFLIPYKRRAKVNGQWVDVYDCQFQIGARGFITLGYRSPEIGRWDARAIHDGDHWKEMAGSRAFLEHSVALKDRGDTIGAYSHVMLQNGSELALVLPLSEIEKIRAKSETYRSLIRKVEEAGGDAKEREKALRNLDETPWVMWFDDMAEKSAIKKHAKKLPIAAGEALAAATELDSSADAGMLDLKSMTDPDLVRAVVADEETAPALEHSEPETLVSSEAFGTAQRQPEKVARGATTRAQRKASAEDATPAAYATPTANDFVNRIDEAVDKASADAVLEEARKSGLADDQLRLVEEAHRMATSSGE